MCMYCIFSDWSSVSISWQQICATLFRKLWEIYIKNKFLQHNLLHIYISDQKFAMKQNLEKKWMENRETLRLYIVDSLKLGHLHWENF